MKRLRKGTICIALAVAGLAFSSRADAAHATNFLNALESEVTNRVAQSDTNLSQAQQRALESAARTLARNTRTLSADLGVLATAATQLNARFSNDATLASLEADAVSDYSSAAHARLDGVHLWIGTNTLSPGLSNQVAKADRALDRADTATSSVPVQARALAVAFNKILPVERKVRSLFTAPIAPPVVTNTPPPPPTTVPPGTPGLAPDSVGTRHVDLYENAVVNEQTVFYLSTAESGAKIYNVHHPEELGLWAYYRTGADVAVIMVDPDYPGNADPRPLNLRFTSTSGGTFTATTYFGEAIEGTFSVIE